MDRIGKTTVQILKECGAIITEGHFVFNSGNHGDTFVNKDALYLRPERVSMLCELIAERYMGSDIDVVAGPEKSGIILSQWTAYRLGRMEGRTVPAVFAEKEESMVLSNENATNADMRNIHISHKIGDSMIELCHGEKLVKKSDRFIFKPGYAEVVKGKRVLIVEDVLNTCKTVNNIVDAVKAHGGFVVGIGALCDRSNPATRSQIKYSPRTIALAHMPLSAWSADECPMCANNIPVRTDLGKGSDFLAAQKSA